MTITAAQVFAIMPSARPEYVTELVKHWSSRLRAVWPSRFKTDLADAPVDPEAWAAPRDLPQNPNDPRTPEWPNEP